VKADSGSDGSEEDIKPAKKRQSLAGGGVKKEQVKHLASDSEDEEEVERKPAVKAKAKPASKAKAAKKESSVS
jgi:hypothetical protein